MPQMTDAGRESRGKYLDIADKLGEEIRDGKFIKGNFAGVIYEPLAGPIGDEINPHILELFDKKKTPVVLLDCDIVPSRAACCSWLNGKGGS